MLESEVTIEQEIAQLEKQLQEKKANLGQQSEQKESLPDKEILREVITEKIQSRLEESRILDSQSESGQHAPAYIPKPAPQTQTDDTGSTPPELKDKIQELVNIVFQNSLDQGIKEVVKSKNPALIDAFHDVLVDQLYDTLLERKKVNPIT